MSGNLSQEISLYFHIPFCTHKCGYCHFYVVPDREPFKEILMEGLKNEWRLRLPLLYGKKIVSIYFGGGTPSLLGPERIHSIIQWIKQEIGFEQTTEVTLEANPENISLQLMREYAQAGINRVSIGIQTLNDSILKRLERQHGSQKAIDAVYRTAEAGIQNITIDLMYDLPDQTLSIWEETLEKVRELPITHLSLYNMTIEPHTTFFKKREQLQKLLPDQETSLKIYEMAQQMLSEKNLEQYEISAFAKPNYPSIHNTGYWKGRPFLGFGPSAFSYWEGSRFSNIANLHRYNQQLKANQFPVDFTEKLDPISSLRELLAIRIRLIEGVDLHRFQEQFGSLDKNTFEAIEELQRQKLIVKEGNILQLTKQGILFYDSVAIELIT